MGHWACRGLAVGRGAASDPLGALGLMLVAAMALTPFLNNAATVLVMERIAAGIACELALSRTRS
jgi:di/tricarboxylate transporter